MKRLFLVSLLLFSISLWATAPAQTTRSTPGNSRVTTSTLTVKPDGPAGGPKVGGVGGPHRPLAPVPAPGSAKPESLVKWVGGYDEAMAMARETGKIVMVDFYTEWCAPCRMLDAQTFSDPKVAEAVNRLIPVKVNAEEDRSTAMEYGVRSYPTILFLSSKGEVLHEITGFKPPEAFSENLEDVRGGKTPFMQARAWMEEGTQDAGKQFEIARLLIRERKIAEAAPWMERAAAGLPDEKKVMALRVLPFMYLDLKNKDRANLALNEYKSHPKSDPEDVADAEIELAYHVKDWARLEAALDHAVEIAADPRKKTHLLRIKSSLAPMLPSGKKGVDPPPKKVEAKTAVSSEATTGTGSLENPKASGAKERPADAPAGSGTGEAGKPDGAAARR